MKILALMHRDLVPPEDFEPKGVDWKKLDFQTEYEVVSTLRKVGHQVEVLGVVQDLRKIRNAIESFQPRIVFNLLEEFLGEAIFDQNVVSYLELLRTPYTGCNPRGLMLARDKALSKKILSYHRIRTPTFKVFPMSQRRLSTGKMQFPSIVKCLKEEASLGLAQQSLVRSKEKLEERVRHIHQTLQTDAIAEEFVEGREYYVGVYGNARLKVLPLWELRFAKSKNPGKEFYSEAAKFNDQYRKRHGITTGPADLPADLSKRVYDICKRTYRALEFNGYARIDLRIDENEKIYVIEGNPNPDISAEDDFALSAKEAGIDYDQLLNSLVRLGLQWKPTDV